MCGSHSFIDKLSVAILTGKSTKYRKGVKNIIFRIVSGNSRRGIICPDKIIFEILYAITKDLTSPNQNEKQTIMK